MNEEIGEIIRKNSYRGSHVTFSNLWSYLRILICQYYPVIVIPVKNRWRNIGKKTDKRDETDKQIDKHVFWPNTSKAYDAINQSKHKVKPWSQFKARDMQPQYSAGKSITGEKSGKTEEATEHRKQDRNGCSFVRLVLIGWRTASLEWLGNTLTLQKDFWTNYKVKKTN